MYMLSVTETVLRKLSLVAAFIGGAAMLVMLAIVGANIALRPFGESIRGTVEISGYLCALAVGLCMPAAQLAGSHIAAGLWASALPEKGRKLRAAFGNCVCAAFLFAVAGELHAIAEYASDMGEYIEGFGFSYYGMALLFAFGIALHAALFLLAAVKAAIPAKAGAAPQASSAMLGATAEEASKTHAEAA